MGLIDLTGATHKTDRKAISRRIVKIPVENTTFAVAKTDKTKIYYIGAVGYGIVNRFNYFIRITFAFII